MSINDKIKVLWKTSCEWRDKLHFPKQRDFQLREGESEGSLLPLKLGDWAKIKLILVLAGTMWRSQKAGRQNQGKVCVARWGNLRAVSKFRF